ncbi:YcjF family protein [Lutibaculum baratangense]|uniref:TIGR01620 family protein n=1 Tax=Lutibaculum baratangense AMV1 TaxID=631454 RepID=V4RN91_9HYPH|nr:TIGR01620 family protein [Lutibaculum baratangense]ESR26754.1 hypothetical protein N177_0538 [Lutibaculum baratangense AMV1]
MSEERRRPTAFRLGDPKVLVEKPDAPEDTRDDGRTVIRPEREEAEETALVSAPTLKRKPFRFGTLLISGLGALVTLGIGIWITDFVLGLFARNDALAYLALAAAGLAGVGFVGLVSRELFALMRLARITEIREEAEAAAARDDREAARKVLGQLVSLYAGRPELARARHELSEHAKEIIDGRDLIRLAERDVMAPLDMQARTLIIGSARRVSIVTAASPRAVVDLLFVLYEALRLVRGIGALYGGRPTGLALVRLLRLTVAHLAVTGGVAVTDGLVHQIIGHGVAARLSARLGEGVINGLMTARIGLAALDVARPLPWIAAEPPRMGDILNVIGGSGRRTGKERPDG